MSISEKQLEKATLKTQATIAIIKALIKMNSALDRDDIKSYAVKLKYATVNDVYKFFIEIYKGELKPEKIFNIKFSLKNLNKGKLLLGNIIKLFSEKEFLYSGFANVQNSDIHDHFFIKGLHNVNLFYKINTIEDQEKLESYNRTLNNKWNGKALVLKKKNN